MRTPIRKFNVLKILETEIQVFGIPYSDLKILLVEALAIPTFPMLLDMFGYTLGTYFFLFMLVLIVATIVILRRMGKHKYKNYAISALQFRLWQPKLIRVSKRE